LDDLDDIEFDINTDDNNTLGLNVDSEETTEKAKASEQNPAVSNVI
jgi:hypothetical protein